MPTNGWRDAAESRNALAEPPERTDTYEATSEAASGDDRGQQGANERPEARRAGSRSSEPHSEDIRKIQVDDEDRLAFRVGVNALTLILLGFGIWLLVTYVF